MVGDYLAFGLRIRSDLALPELPPFHGGPNAPTIRVGLGHVAAPRPSNDRPISTSASGPDDFILDVRGIGRFWIQRGEEMVVEPAEDVEVAALRLYLLGTAMGVLCYQRGLQPLHANIVSIDGVGVAFAGESGAGKSTLAAFLSERSYRVLCDDVCVLSFDLEGRPVVWPGVSSSFKLCGDAVTALGRDQYKLQQLVDRKYQWPNPTGTVAAPLPFGRLYALATAIPPSPTAIRRLRGADALRVFAENVYRPQVLRRLNRQSAPLANGVKALRHAQVFAFERAWGFPELERSVAVLERHLRDHPVKFSV